MEFFLNNAPDLIIGGIGIEVAVETKQAASDETGKPGGESGDGIDHLAESTPSRSVNDSPGICKGKLIKSMNDRTQEAPAMSRGEKTRHFEQLAFELDRYHGC